MFCKKRSCTGGRPDEGQSYAGDILSVSSPRKLKNGRNQLEIYNPLAVCMIHRPLRVRLVSSHAFSLYLFLSLFFFSFPYFVLTSYLSLKWDYNNAIFTSIVCKRDLVKFTRKCGTSLPFPITTKKKKKKKLVDLINTYPKGEVPLTA